MFKLIFLALVAIWHGPCDIQVNDVTSSESEPKH